jgi:fructose-bisphosphate aldolase class I
MSTPTTAAAQSLRRGARLLLDGLGAPGARADTGTVPLAGAPGELVTEGLDGLTSRLAELAGTGVRFATWRAVFTLGERRPSEWALRVNADAMARFARASQELGIVPVVGAQLTLDGPHSQRECAGATAAVLLLVSRALADASVDPAATVLSPTMVVPGIRCSARATPKDVAALTVDTLLVTVPAQIAGIAFLPGGQGCPEANLAAMHALATPWPLTLCSRLFARRRHLSLVR